MAFNKFGNALSHKPTAMTALAPHSVGDRVVTGGMRGVVQEVTATSVIVLLDGESVPRPFAAHSLRKTG